jgi:acyl carrier protein
MSHEDILEQVREIMLDVFDLDELTISDNTTAKDIEDWDSLSHIRLVVSVEKHFGIRFSTAEIESFDTVGAMVRAIAAKTA